MKLRIEAETEDELRTKGPELLHRLSKALRQHAPDIADVLEKASSVERPHQLRHGPLREGAEELHREYATMLEQMLTEIGAALDAHVEG